jgi:hypothetical protein
MVGKNGMPRAKRVKHTANKSLSANPQCGMWFRFQMTGVGDDLDGYSRQPEASLLAPSVPAVPADFQRVRLIEIEEKFQPLRLPDTPTGQNRQEVHDLGYTVMSAAWGDMVSGEELYSFFDPAPGRSRNYNVIP